MAWCQWQGQVQWPGANGRAGSGENAGHKWLGTMAGCRWQGANGRVQWPGVMAGCRWQGASSRVQWQGAKFEWKGERGRVQVAGCNGRVLQLGWAGTSSEQ